MKYQIPKGLFDILPYGTSKEWQFTHQWQYVEKVLHTLASTYNFLEIRPPMFESTEVFLKVGESTDIVSKEMYTFLDKSNRSLTLRPELTAPVVRAFVENNLSQFGQCHKFYYIGPMFRYERMQRGRYRQFHQFGVEFLGSSIIESDVEVIDLLNQTFAHLGLKNRILMINSVGSISSREQYREELKKYLFKIEDELSLESKERLQKNPLRILDSKDPKDIELLKNAPSILSFLSPESKKRFDDICELLTKISIPFTINDRLVRGLDYYTDTVFEFQTTLLGSQNALGGGGRYDNLVSSFGGPDIPGVGFAAGIERIIESMIQEEVYFPKMTYPFVYFFPMENDAKDLCFSLCTELRHSLISSEVDLDSKKIQKALQIASEKGSIYFAIIGSEELKNNRIQLKNLEKRTQEIVSIEAFLSFIKKLWKEFKG